MSLHVVDPSHSRVVSEALTYGRRQRALGRDFKAKCERIATSILSNADTQRRAQNNPDFRANAIAVIVFAELIHKAGGEFSDKNVDNAALKLMSPAEQQAAKLEMNSKNYEAGRVGYRKLKENCPPPQRK